MDVSHRSVCQIIYVNSVCFYFLLCYFVLVDVAFRVRVQTTLRSSVRYRVQQRDPATVLARFPLHLKKHFPVCFYGAFRGNQLTLQQLDQVVLMNTVLLFLLKSDIRFA